MLWRVAWNRDRSRRVIFAEPFWASVEEVADVVADPDEFRSAIESMGDAILQLFAEDWQHLIAVTPSTKAHLVAHLDRGELITLVVVGRELPPPPSRGPASVVVESVSVVERR